MKVKLDENLPASLIEELAALGHDVDSVVATDRKLRIRRPKT